MPSPRSDMPLLHEEHADQRRARADDEPADAARAACTRGRTATAAATASRQQFTAHQRQTSSSQSGRSSACMPRLTPVAASSPGGPSNSDAPLQHDHAVEVVGDRAELVRHEQHRGAVLAHEVHERVAEQPLRLRVDARDRLVEHEQLGLAGERLGDERRAAADRPRARRARRRRRSASATDSSAWSTAARSAARGGRHQPCLRQPARRRRPPRRSPGRSGAMRSRCGTYPTRQRSRRRRGRRAEQLRPCPASGASSPSSDRSSVDLPEPFGPTSATNSPARTARLTSSSTGSAP